MRLIIFWRKLDNYSRKLWTNSESKENFASINRFFITKEQNWELSSIILALFEGKFWKIKLICKGLWKDNRKISNKKADAIKNNKYETRMTNITVTRSPEIAGNFITENYTEEKSAMIIELLLLFRIGAPSKKLISSLSNSYFKIYIELIIELNVGINLFWLY